MDLVVLCSDLATDQNHARAHAQKEVQLACCVLHCQFVLCRGSEILNPPFCPSAPHCSARCGTDRRDTTRGRALCCDTFGAWVKGMGALEGRRAQKGVSRAVAKAVTGG